MFKILDQLIDELLSSYFEINTKWKSLEEIWLILLMQKVLHHVLRHLLKVKETPHLDLYHT